MLDRDAAPAAGPSRSSGTEDESTIRSAAHSTSRRARFSRGRSSGLTGGVLVSVVALTACTADSGAGPAAETKLSAVGEITAERVLKVSEPHEETGMTLLEGPTFDDEGNLLLVDVTAPARGDKVMCIDLDSDRATRFHTDDESAFTSAQWGPNDDRLYLTDYAGGRIISVGSDGDDAKTVFEGDVGGRQMHPDDLAFDSDGNLFVSDSAATAYPGAEPAGRVIRIDADSSGATVLAKRQPNPNGISLGPDDDELWVSQLDADRIDRLLLNDDHTAVTTGHTAFHIDGGAAQTDSNGIDAEGNVYQAMHGIPEIRVHSRHGQHLATVRIPDGEDELESATNIAIRPGTDDAYVTVSGPEGGFVYRFDALGEGTRQSNGG